MQENASARVQNFKIPIILKLAMGQMVRKYKNPDQIVEFLKSKPYTKVPEIPEGKSNGMEISGKKFPSLAIPCKVFMEIVENAVPFATGNFLKFKLGFSIE